jgi:hypothetical protein
MKDSLIKNVRLFLILCSLFPLATLVSCDLRNETAKKGVEKYSSTPQTPVAPLPSPTPVDPADIAMVDTSLEGNTITVSGHEQKKTVSCSKYNRVMVNGDGSVINVAGICRQIMINGDGNKITLDAAMEIVLNGSDNSMRHSRYANGKQPSVIDNRGGNIVEKIPAMTSGPPSRKINQ